MLLRRRRLVTQPCPRFTCPNAGDSASATAAAFSSTLSTATRHASITPAVQGHSALPETEPVPLVSSSFSVCGSLDAHLAMLSPVRQRVLGRDVQLFGLAALAAKASQRPLPLTMPSAVAPSEPSRAGDELTREDVEASTAHAHTPPTHWQHRRPRTVTELQQALARQYAASGSTSSEGWQLTSPESHETHTTLALRRLLAATQHAHHALTTAEGIMWAAYHGRETHQGRQDHHNEDKDVPAESDDVTYDLACLDASSGDSASVPASRESPSFWESLLHMDCADASSSFSSLLASSSRAPLWSWGSSCAAAGAVAKTSLSPAQQSALVGWCGRQVRGCVAHVRAVLDALCEPHQAQRVKTVAGVTREVRQEQGERRAAAHAHTPAVLELPALGQGVRRDPQAASVVLTAARDVCGLLETYLHLVVDGLFVQGGFGDEEEADQNQSAHASATSPSSSASSSSPSSRSAQIRVEARETCESVLAILEVLESEVLPAWLESASAVTAEALSSHSAPACEDPQHLLHTLRLDVPTMQLALCSQREHWPSALGLTARMCRWNERLAHRAESDPRASDTARSVDETQTSADHKSSSTPTASPTTTTTTMTTHENEVRQIAAFLPQDAALSLAYVLAQHGQATLTDLLLDALAHHHHATLPRRKGEEAATHGFAATLIRALAIVNSGPAQASATTTAPSTSSARASGQEGRSMERHGALVTLVRHGMLPNRVLGVAEYAGLLRLVDELHQWDTLSAATGPMSRPAHGSQPASPSSPPSSPRLKKDWVLSPAQIWRHTAGYPHPLRLALCLLSFQVLVRHTLTDSMSLEDLFVVESLTRQALRQQRRALEWQCRHRERGCLPHGTEDNDDSAARPPPPPRRRDEDGTNAAGAVHRSEEAEAEEEEALQTWCGALPPLLLPARRPAAPCSAAHLIHLCGSYQAIHTRLRRRSEGSSVPLKPALHSSRGSDVLITLVPRELVRTLQGVHGTVTLQTVLVTCWEAALSATLATQFNHHSPLLWPSTGAGAASLSGPSSSASPHARATEDAETQPAALLVTLADALVEHIDEADVPWSKATQASSSSSPSWARAASSTSSTLEQAAASHDGSRAEQRVEPLLQLVPYLDPFMTAKLVLGPAGRHMTWTHCLSLLPYTPLGSPSQLLLLRRVAQDRHGRQVASAHLQDTLHWSQEAMRNVSAATARGSSAGSATLTAEQQALSVLLETQWSRALQKFDAVPHHAQITAAPHVVRLLVEADVWRDVSDSTLRPLVRLAIRAAPGGQQQQQQQRRQHDTTTTAPAAVRANVTMSGDQVVAGAFSPSPALSQSQRGLAQSDAASRLTEEVLQTALHRGLWLTGLHFHQLVAEEDPALVHCNPRARQYASLLSRGLLEKSALTRAVALILRACRRGQWETAVSHFLDYATHGADVTHTATTAGTPSRSLVEQASSSHDGPLKEEACLWPFRASIPHELSHLEQALRFATLQTQSRWQFALTWFPVSASVPLPFSHEGLVKARFGTLPTAASPASSSLSSETVALLSTLAACSASSSSSSDGVQMVPSSSVQTPATNLDSSKAAATALTAMTPPPPSDMIATARHSSKVQRPALQTRATHGAVHDALQHLHHHGEWEMAMLLYERALEAGVFPYQDTAVALATTIDGGAPWHITLHFFERMTQHMRPDVATAAVALQACAAGQQWAMALRVLRQCVLTQTRPAPYLVESAIQTALHCGVWARALHAAHTYRRTRNARLAHAVLSTYVATKQWDEAVQYFYDCAVRGLRPLDASIELALAASEAASEEYRATALMVGTIASALEDVYHISGVIMEHVVVVHRHWHREHALQGIRSAAAPPSPSQHPTTPLKLEAASALHVMYDLDRDRPTPCADPYSVASVDSDATDTSKRVYPLQFF